MKAQYSYTVLRYAHDITTGEFVNVGVALFSTDLCFLGGRFRTTYGRLAKVFPGMNGQGFKTLMRRIQAEVDQVGSRLNSEFDFVGFKSIMEIAHQVLPPDDSALQWSTPGSGVTANPEGELESLFERLVMRYDDKIRHETRSDDDVWREYKRGLETRNVLQFLDRKKFSVSDDEVEFSYAWQNGIWHCLEPISFDMVHAERIREKAHKWLGHLMSVKDAPETFKIYFLLGEPTEPSLREAVENAVKILEKVPVEREIVRESRSAEFCRAFAADMHEHLES